MIKFFEMLKWVINRLSSLKNDNQITFPVHRDFSIQKLWLLDFLYHEPFVLLKSGNAFFSGTWKPSNQMMTNDLTNCLLWKNENLNLLLWIFSYRVNKNKNQLNTFYYVKTFKNILKVFAITKRQTFYILYKEYWSKMRLKVHFMWNGI